MSRPWRLTRQAEVSLVDIARWTLEHFRSDLPAKLTIVPAPGSGRGN